MSYIENLEKIQNVTKNIDLPQKNDNVFLFGADWFGATAASELKNELQFTAICDNDEKKQGRVVEGLPVIAPKELTQYPNAFVLVCTFRHYNSIHQQLDTMKVRHCDLDAYLVQRNFDKIETVLQFFDDTSKNVYTGLLFSRITSDLSEAVKYSCDNQYFCLPEFHYLDIEKGAFVDCGAFVGDTLEEMIKNSLGSVSRIYAFEPMERTYRALQKRVSFLCDIWALEPERIVCEQMAVGKKEGTASFRDVFGNLQAASLTTVGGEGQVPVVSLDEYFAQRQGEYISFIKADIEGSEWNMLHGAEETIKKNKPKLAICIYHTILDFFRIPLYLKELVPEYKFQVRHHSNVDTVLYCYI